MTLGELTAAARRVALVGLAKNTGKTVALAALLRELQAEGRCVGVTSVGRDGEQRDVIDARIEKPRVRLAAGSLVATTDGLLRASAIPHELLEDTGVRTPLGRVLIARLAGAGTIELAGPSAAADVRAVSDTMLAHGAEQVLIDGAVDRRAASSPQVSDGLIISTGAVLDRDISEVVLQTSDAVELVRLTSIDDGSEAGRRLSELARAATANDAAAADAAAANDAAAAQDAAAAPDANDADADAAANATRPSLLVSEDGEPVALPPRLVLCGEAEQVAQLLDANPGARWLLVAGALPDRFLRMLVHAVHRRRRELVLVVADPTRVFLWKRGPDWYRRQGVQLRTLNPIELHAITVNPVAPQSHSFDSAELRGLLEEAIPDVPIFDVLHPDYAGVRRPRLEGATSVSATFAREL